MSNVPTATPSPHQPSPAAASTPTAAAPAAPTVIVKQSGGLIWRILALMGWMGFGLVTLLAIGQFLAFMDYFDTSHGIIEKYHSGEKFATDKVAIIAVEGVIASGEGFVKSQIDQVRNDTNVKAVIVRVNSPGGTVTGSDYILHHLTRLREDRKIPLVVSMGGLAASGGYYVAMSVGDQEQSIFAEPTTTTGSIGVMFPHYDISGLLARFDVKDDSLVTHPRKEMGSMTKAMPEEHRQLLQNYINESLGRFKDVIKQGRPRFRQNVEALDQLATGEIFSATQAKKHGLVDEIGFIEEAIDRVVALAGLTKDKVRVVHFERPLSLFDLGGLARAPAGMGESWSGSRLPGEREWSTLVEWSAPRAYYLASTVPPLLSSYANLLAPR